MTGSENDVVQTDSLNGLCRACLVSATVWCDQGVCIDCHHVRIIDHNVLPSTSLVEEPIVHPLVLRRESLVPRTPPKPESCYQL